MKIFVVTSLRQYENEETHFGCDGLFPDYDRAAAYVKSDMEETLQEQPELEQYADFDDFDIVGNGHCFKWQIEPAEIPMNIELEGFVVTCGSRKYADIKKIMEKAIGTDAYFQIRSILYDVTNGN